MRSVLGSSRQRLSRWVWHVKQGCPVGEGNMQLSWPLSWPGLYLSVWTKSARCASLHVWDMNFSPESQSRAQLVCRVTAKKKKNYLFLSCTICVASTLIILMTFQTGFMVCSISLECDESVFLRISAVRRFLTQISEMKIRPPVETDMANTLSNLV